MKGWQIESSTGSRVRGPVAIAALVVLGPFLPQPPESARVARRSPQASTPLQRRFSSPSPSIRRPPPRAADLRAVVRPFRAAPDLAVGSGARGWSDRMRPGDFRCSPDRGAVRQGLGACAGPALGRAMIRDLYGAKGSAKAMAFVASALSIAPAIAPVSEAISPAQPGGRGSSRPSRSSGPGMFVFVLLRGRGNEPVCLARRFSFGIHACSHPPASSRAAGTSATCPSPQRTVAGPLCCFRPRPHSSSWETWGSSELIRTG